MADPKPAKKQGILQDIADHVPRPGDFRRAPVSPEAEVRDNKKLAAWESEVRRHFLARGIRFWALSKIVMTCHELLGGYQLREGDRLAWDSNKNMLLGEPGPSALPRPGPFPESARDEEARRRGPDPAPTYEVGVENGRVVCSGSSRVRLTKIFGRLEPAETMGCDPTYLAHRARYFGGRCGRGPSDLHPVAAMTDRWKGHGERRVAAAVAAAWRGETARGGARAWAAEVLSVRIATEPSGMRIRDGLKASEMGWSYVAHVRVRITESPPGPLPIEPPPGGTSPMAAPVRFDIPADCLLGQIARSLLETGPATSRALARTLGRRKTDISRALYAADRLRDTGGWSPVLLIPRDDEPPLWECVDAIEPDAEPEPDADVDDDDEPEPAAEAAEPEAGADDDEPAADVDEPEAGVDDDEPAAE